MKKRGRKKLEIPTVQFNRRLPIDCVQDFELAIAVNKPNGHKGTNVIIDLMNYYTDYGLPPAPQVPDA